MKRILYIIAAALLFVGCVKTPAATVPQAEPEATAETMTEATAAVERTFHFKTTDLDGNAFSEDAFEDYDLVMLNFWAYWCPPCRAEMPDLEKLHQAYPNILLLGVIVDDSDMDETRAVIENTGVTYPVLYPKGDLLLIANRAQYIPTTVFLDANGNTLGEPVVGGHSYDDWKAIVEALLP